jgi:hypothetical protein
MLKNYKELRETRRGGPPCLPAPVPTEGGAGRLEFLDPTILFAKDFLWKTEF